MVKKRKNLRKPNNLVLGIFFIGVVLILVLFWLILINVGVFDSSKGEIAFPILDECSLVLGNLIHPLGDSGDCEVRCLNECRIQGFEFDRVEFSLGNSSCNSCECYCENE